jgi:hypothetical protein
MASLTETQIKKLVSETKDHSALVAALTEEPYLKPGSDVYITSSMGQSNVSGKFVEENNGWGKVKRDDGTELWVLYHTIKPKDSGLNSK